MTGQQRSLSFSKEGASQFSYEKKKKKTAGQIIVQLWRTKQEGMYGSGVLREIIQPKDDREGVLKLCLWCDVQG